MSEEVWLDDERGRPKIPALVIDSAEAEGEITVVPADVPVALEGLFGQHLQGVFYPRFIFDGAVLNFEDPCNDLAIDVSEIGTQNLSLAGFIEGLSIRHDYRLTMTFQTLSYAVMNNLFGWWLAWGSRSKPTEIILDRFGTCTGQWEFDRFNTYFSRAVCLTRMKAPKRLTRGRQLFVCQLVFQQVPVDA